MNIAINTSSVGEYLNILNNNKTTDKDNSDKTERSKKTYVETYRDRKYAYMYMVDEETGNKVLIHKIPLDNKEKSDNNMIINDTDSSDEYKEGLQLEAGEKKKSRKILQDISDQYKKTDTIEDYLDKIKQSA